MQPSPVSILRSRHYAAASRRQHVFKAGEQVYSKRCGKVGGFDGVIVTPRAGGFQVLDPQTGNTYQRDHRDLLPLSEDRGGV